MKKVVVVSSLALFLGACSLGSLFSENKAGADSSSSDGLGASSSSQAGNLSSSANAALDSLKKIAQSKLSATELQMVSGLDPKCQLEYLGMSVGSDPMAKSTFFGDQGCFSSVVNAMAPAGLDAQCQGLWKDPFNYYQSGWQSIEKCKSTGMTDPNCAPILDPLMQKTSAFHQSCPVQASFPWEKDFQGGGDTTGMKDPNQMKAFCADPANSSKPECVQFTKCSPLFEQQNALSMKVTQEVQQCSSNPVCTDSVKMSYQPQFEALNLQFQQNGCVTQGQNSCEQIKMDKAATLNSMQMEMSKCTDEACKMKIQGDYSIKLQSFETKLTQNQCQ